jgi:hypothetical protein
VGLQLAVKLKAQRSADFWVPIGASKRVVRFGRVDAGDRVEIFLSQRAFFPVDPMAEPNTCLKHELGECSITRVSGGITASRIDGWRRLSVCFGLFAGIGSFELRLFLQDIDLQ